MARFPLVDIALDLLGVLISSWLDLKSVVRLDSSFCNRSDRQIFLCTLKSDHVALSTLPAIRFSNEILNYALRWAVIRTVKFKTLVIRQRVKLDVLDKSMYLHKPIIENVYAIDLTDTTGMCACFMVVTHCRSLVSISFESSSLGSYVRHILTNCTALREIFFYKCTNLSADAFQGVTCPTLQTLALSHCACNDECILAAVNVSGALVNLNIGGNNLTDHAIRGAITKLPQLKKLGLCKLKVSDKTMAAIASACPSLSAVDLSRCSLLSDATVVAIVARCTQLDQLLLPDNNNGKLTRRTFTAIANSCVALKRMQCDQIQDPGGEDEKHFLKSCTQLQTLDMQFYWAQNAGLVPTTVTTLHLNAGNVQDNMLVALSRRCQNLTTLVLKANPLGGREYTWTGLAALVKGCPHLKRLVLGDDVVHVAGFALELLRNTCPYVRVLQSLEWWEHEIFAPAWCTV